MVDILIQPPELRRISEQLRTSAQKIAAAMQGIDNDISWLKGDKFLGNRSDKVMANYAPQREALLTAKNIVLHFADELKNTANIFEQADRSDVRKIIHYLMNGINWNGDEGKLNELITNIKQKYGDNVDVRIVKAHPFDSNFQQYEINTKYGTLLSIIDWRLGASVWLYNKSLGVANTVYGVSQVTTEYITGWSSQSEKVYTWIANDLDELRKSGLIDIKDVDVVLDGYSGSGAIAPNIGDDIEKLGVNVSEINLFGAPLSNVESVTYAKINNDYVDSGDYVGRLGGIGPVRSAPVNALTNVVDALINGPNWQAIGGNILSLIKANPSLDLGRHTNSYWNNSEVIESFRSGERL